MLAGPWAFAKTFPSAWDPRELCSRCPTKEMALSPAPPVLESPESSEEQVVAKGSDVTFTCEASGSPAPTVTWLKLGKTPVLPSERVANGPQLGLGAVGPADAGVYVCVASNEAGEASRAFSLLVMGACLPWAGGADPGEQLRDEPSRLPCALQSPPKLRTLPTPLRCPWPWAPRWS